VTLLRPLFAVFVSLTLVTGVLYPALVTAVAQLAFPHQAGGSLLLQGERVVGSELVGQPFDDPRYFWGRPSATAEPYDAAASSGSNYGPLHPDLQKTASSRVAALDAGASVPVDLLTASGSGLDPHISPEGAALQVPRVASARGLDPSQVSELVAAHTQSRTLGVLGEPRVNVLALNLALDALQSRP
jgi:K+-transporting ATPase ATPase C chain